MPHKTAKKASKKTRSRRVLRGTAVKRRASLTPLASQSSVATLQQYKDGDKVEIIECSHSDITPGDVGEIDGKPVNHEGKWFWPVKVTRNFGTFHNNVPGVKPRTRTFYFEQTKEIKPYATKPATSSKN